MHLQYIEGEAIQYDFKCIDVLYVVKKIIKMIILHVFEFVSYCWNSIGKITHITIVTFSQYGARCKQI